MKYMYTVGIKNSQITFIELFLTCICSCTISVKFGDYCYTCCNWLYVVKKCPKEKTFNNFLFYGCYVAFITLDNRVTMVLFIFNILKENIYIFIAIVLDETSPLVAVYFSMQNIYKSCDLIRAVRRSNVDVSQ